MELEQEEIPEIQENQEALKNQVLSLKKICNLKLFSKIFEKSYNIDRSQRLQYWMQRNYICSVAENAKDEKSYKKVCELYEEFVNDYPHGENVEFPKLDEEKQFGIPEIVMFLDGPLNLVQPPQIAQVLQASLGGTKITVTELINYGNMKNEHFDQSIFRLHGGSIKNCFLAVIDNLPEDEESERQRLTDHELIHGLVDIAKLTDSEIAHPISISRPNYLEKKSRFRQMKVWFSTRRERNRFCDNFHQTLAKVTSPADLEEPIICRRKTLMRENRQKIMNYRNALYRAQDSAENEPDFCADIEDSYKYLCFKNLYILREIENDNVLDF